MNVLNKISATFKESKKNLQTNLEEYISFPKANQLTLGEKTVLFLCEQAESKVEMLNSLKPDSKEGLIATVQHEKIVAQLHFTPEKITLHKDCIEGEIRLLKKPEFETDSIIYRSLIAGWKTFLGGKIPNRALPKEVRIKGNKIYYTLPRNELQLLDALFHTLENGSALTTNLKEGSLTIESSVALSWNDFKLANLLHIFNRK